MAARRTTFGKTQREREKRAKQVAKREKKQAMSEMEPEEEGTAEATPAPVDQEAVISQLEKLHERYADGGMSLDDFEAAREELLARLTV